MSSEQKPQPQPKPKPKPTKKEKSSWEGVEGFAKWLGQYCWIFVLIEGVLFIIWGIVGLAWLAAAEAAVQEVPGAAAAVAYDIALARLTYTLWIIGGILGIIFAVALVKPRFSNKWADKDYDYLLNDVVKIGSLRIPLFLIIGIVLEILMSWWGGLIIIIPLLLLIFMGPKEYKWKE